MTAHSCGPAPQPKHVVDNCQSLNLTGTTQLFSELSAVRQRASGRETRVAWIARRLACLEPGEPLFSCKQGV